MKSSSRMVNLSGNSDHVLSVDAILTSSCRSSMWYVYLFLYYIFYKRKSSIIPLKSIGVLHYRTEVSRAFRGTSNTSYIIGHIGPLLYCIDVVSTIINIGVNRSELTLLKLDFKFCIELSMEKAYRAL